MRSIARVIAGLVGCLFVSSAGGVVADAQAADAKPLVLNMRKRVEIPVEAKAGVATAPAENAAPATKRYHTITTPAEWDSKQTAVVICDMWDKHWCPNATAQAVEPYKSPRDEVKGKHMEPHGEAPLWGCE